MSKLEPNKKYKVIDDGLVNGYIIVTGKQLEYFIDQAYKELKSLKKWVLTIRISTPILHKL